MKISIYRNLYYTINYSHTAASSHITTYTHKHVTYEMRDWLLKKLEKRYLLISSVSTITQEKHGK
jgi:hypothetical protein